MTEADKPEFGPGRRKMGLLGRLRRAIQEHPQPLALIWRVFEAALRKLRRPFERMGPDRASRWVRPFEDVVKRPLFDCQMCGQCILHSTGMTCPMTCPKQLRNGPCGGVRLDGKCEVEPSLNCVWVDAVARSERSSYRDDLGRLNPPVDWRLQGSASWVTFAVGRDEIESGSGAGPHHVAEVLRK